MEDLSDEELLVACREAPVEEVRRAVGILARRHHRAIFAYLHRFVGRREAAEDLTQETFVRVFRHARRYKTIAKVTTWMYTIAHNLAVNELRNRKVRRALSLNAPADREGEGAAFVDHLEGGTPGPVDRLEEADRRRQVWEAIQELPEHYRAAILLVDIEGMSYQEAAEALGVRLGTVRSRLNRARGRFEELMRPYMEG